MINCLLVALGGGAGALLRYFIGLIPVREQTIFPYKTLIINITGSLLIGIVMALVIKNKSVDPRLILFLKVGFCGGFTTFSSFALETEQLIQNGNILTAAIYVLLSLILGTAAVFAGQIIIR